mgnify:CR=1 FL=1
MGTLAWQRLRIIKLDIPRERHLILSPWIISMPMVVVSDQQFTIFNGKGLSDQLIVHVTLVHQYLLEYLLAHNLFDHHIRLLEVGEQDHKHFLRVWRDLYEVYHARDVMEVSINHFPFRVYPVILSILQRHSSRPFPLRPQPYRHTPFPSV